MTEHDQKAVNPNRNKLKVETCLANAVGEPTSGWNVEYEGSKPPIYVFNKDHSITVVEPGGPDPKGHQGTFSTNYPALTKGTIGPDNLVGRDEPSKYLITVGMDVKGGPQDTADAVNDPNKVRRAMDVDLTTNPPTVGPIRDPLYSPNKNPAVVLKVDRMAEGVKACVTGIGKPIMQQPVKNYFPKP